MENTTKREIFWGPCQIWGQGHLYSSKCVVIPAPLARRLGIKKGDFLTFKDDGTGCITISVTKKEEVRK